MKGGRYRWASGVVRGRVWVGAAPRWATDCVGARWCRCAMTERLKAEERKVNELRETFMARRAQVVAITSQQEAPDDIPSVAVLDARQKDLEKYVACERCSAAVLRAIEAGTVSHGGAGVVQEAAAV